MTQTLAERRQASSVAFHSDIDAIYARWRRGRLDSGEAHRYLLALEYDLDDPRCPLHGTRQKAILAERLDRVRYTVAQGRE
jgi:hypothetical protein